ncbi:NAD(P)-binding protein [Thozetella sp. PMI_491]|nr:NAD(P)-binding protein [Thozetella sp. PMI_491]
MSPLNPSGSEDNLEEVAAVVATSHHDTYPFIDPLKADLAGKSVLITGASKGIGKAAAISFAKAGCSKIGLAARSDLAAVATVTTEAAKKAGRPEPLVLCLRVDVSSEGSVQAAAEAVTDAFAGSLDILINNAGFLDEWHPIAETVTEEWWRSWEVNIKGAYLCSRYFIPLLLNSHTKTIINVSSIGAHMISPGGSGYLTTKFALCRLTEFMDREYRDKGLVAIALHPGGVVTELACTMPEHMHVFLIDTPELAGDTFVWLANRRRDWLTGRYITVCWDMEELEAKKQEILQRNSLKFRLTT